MGAFCLLNNSPTHRTIFCNKKYDFSKFFEFTMSLEIIWQDFTYACTNYISIVQRVTDCDRRLLCPPVVDVMITALTLGKCVTPSMAKTWDSLYICYFYCFLGLFWDGYSKSIKGMYHIRESFQSYNINVVIEFDLSVVDLYLPQCLYIFLQKLWFYSFKIPQLASNLSDNWIISLYLTFEMLKYQLSNAVIRRKLSAVS